MRCYQIESGEEKTAKGNGMLFGQLQKGEIILRLVSHCFARQKKFIEFPKNLNADHNVFYMSHKYQSIP